MAWPPTFPQIAAGSSQGPDWWRGQGALYPHHLPFWGTDALLPVEASFRLLIFPTSPPVLLSSLMVGWQVGDQKAVLKAFLRGHSASAGPSHGPHPIDSPGRNQHLQGSDHRGVLKVSLVTFRD